MSLLKERKEEASFLSSHTRWGAMKVTAAESLGSVRIAHDLLGSENDDDTQNSAVGEFVQTLHL